MPESDTPKVQTFLVVKVGWDSAHRMSSAQYAGNQRIHGHRYEAEVEFRGEPDERGVVLDLEDARRIVEDATALWEHRTILRTGDGLIGDLGAIAINQEPVMEVFATLLMQKVQALVPLMRRPRPVTVTRVRVSSQPDAYAEVYRV